MRWIQDSVCQRDDLTIKFYYEGEVALQDSEEILARVSAVHDQMLAAAKEAAREERHQALRLFADNLSKAFYGFEPDFFQQNVSRIVDAVISQIHASLELWPTLAGVRYCYKDKKLLTQIRVNNKRLESHR